MKRVVFVADYFAEHVLGGGELNNKELINILKKRDYQVEEIQSRFVTLELLESWKDDFIILSNFVEMSYNCREALTNLNYVIYEHDHKYLKSRNPAIYKNFIAPDKDIVNYALYKNAIAVFCQSQFHKKIVESNLELNNIISLGGNLWSDEQLNLLRTLSHNEKKDCCSIMDSHISHKNTYGAIKYCESKSKNYELISHCKYEDFLTRLSKNTTLVFLPKTPETLSRIVVEARMMGISVVTNNLIGATSEPWFKLKAEELIDFMVEKREKIVQIIEESYDSSSSKEYPLVSMITTFHEGEEYLENFLHNITTQTIFDKCELIIIDANSRGNEREIIDKYIQKYDNIIYHRLDKKLKPTPCLNKAIQISNGKYLTLALIDDVKRENAIEILYNEIDKDDTIDLVYGDVIVTDIPNQSFESFKMKEINLFEHSRYNFSKENMVKCLPGPMPLWRKAIHEKTGFFDTESCNYADDWEMWLRAIDAGSKFKKVDQIVGLYLAGGRSQQNDTKQRIEEAKIFYRYSHLFGQNFYKFKPYFDQFLELHG